MNEYALLAGLWGHGHTTPASTGRTTDDTARSRAQQVEARLERLLLTTEALWTILRDKLGVTDEELVQRVVDLDLSDGQLDGQRRRPPLECPSCSRVIPRRFARCLYCGTDIQHDPFA